MNPGNKSFSSLYLLGYFCYNLALMSTITTDDVRHLAQLSNLQLADDEVENLRADIESILGYIAQLAELDTTGVDPTYQVTGLENVWRDDKVQESGVSREQLLQLAPEEAGHSVKVPKVL